MTQTYYFNHKLVKVTTTPQEALEQFLKDAPHSSLELPKCQQLDIAWELSKTPETDAKLRQLIMPTLNELMYSSWSVIPHDIEHQHAAKKIHALRARDYKYGWLRQVKRSPHFPTDIRQLAADLLEEPFDDQNTEQPKN